jgi:opacity protein-like surface antigen
MEMASATIDNQNEIEDRFQGATMTTLLRLSATCAMAAFGLAIYIGAPSAANAQSQADVTQLIEGMKRIEARATALEARVVALEGENKQAKKEAAAARAEAQALRQKLGSSRTAAAPAMPPGTYMMATKAPPLAPTPDWAGLYWGSAFGLGWMRGETSEHSLDVFNQTLGSLINASTTTTNSNLSGRDVGAAVNLFLGYNFLASPSVVLGGQVEGGLSNMRVNVSGSGTSNASGTLAILVPGLIQSGSVPFTSTGAVSANDDLNNRWMVSLLGRGGVLVDPRDLVYALGGYTYGRFEGFGAGFGLNGATVGGGWERSIALGWTLRGEVRYTKFQSKDVTESFASTSTQTAVCACFPNSMTTNDAFARTEHVSADMYSAWLGVAHYFSY